jgi:glycosyltransferase involved in cell wall biosynthesis
MGTGASLFYGRCCSILNKLPIVYSELHTIENLNRKYARYFEFPNRILNYIIPKIPKTGIYQFLPVCKTLSKIIKNNSNGYNIKTLYNGISVHKIQSYLTDSPSELAKKIVLKINNRPTIVQVGRLDTNKNHIFTLRSLIKIKIKIPNVLYIIVGEGENYPLLKEYVLKNNLVGNVIFTGQLDRTTCMKIISNAKVIVLTSFSEAFPMVMLEALSLSVPAVTVNVGGSAEIVRDGENGFVIDNMNEGDFVEKIILLLTDKNLQVKMGICGKNIVNNKFTIRNRVGELLLMINRDLLRSSGLIPSRLRRS